MNTRTAKHQAIIVTGLPARLGEVLIHIAEGMNSKEIARACHKPDGECLTPGTVDQYRNSLLYKLDAKNTAELISKAYQSGVLRALSLFIAFALPLSAYLIADSDLNDMARLKNSQARRLRGRSRARESLPVSGLQGVAPGGSLVVVATWDPDINNFLFNIEEV